VPGFGARPGNSNALKHGAYTGEALAERRRISAFIRQCRRTLEEIGRE
jgi:glucans biosynthesis protein